MGGYFWGMSSTSMSMTVPTGSSLHATWQVCSGVYCTVYIRAKSVERLSTLFGTSLNSVCCHLKLSEACVRKNKAGFQPTDIFYARSPLKRLVPALDEEQNKTKKQNILASKWHWLANTATVRYLTHAMRQLFTLHKMTALVQLTVNWCYVCDLMISRGSMPKGG